MVCRYVYDKNVEKAETEFVSTFFTWLKAKFLKQKCEKNLLARSIINQTRQQRNGAGRVCVLYMV